MVASFAAPLGGATTLGEIKDTTVGADPLPHVVEGAAAASLVFAGTSINGALGRCADEWRRGRRTGPGPLRQRWRLRRLRL